jgi:hypothetical protein
MEKADKEKRLTQLITKNRAPRLARLPIDNSCEDTFVHTYLDCIIDQVFSSEPLFRQSW